MHEQQILRAIREQIIGGASYAQIRASVGGLAQVELDHQLRGLVNAKQINLTLGRYWIAQHTPDLKVPVMAETKRCRACDKDKPIADFYEGHAKCKPCFTIHNKAAAALRAGKLPALAPKPALETKIRKQSKRALTPPDSLEAADLDLPATARISLRMDDAVIELHTDPKIKVCITPSQMDAICVWWKARRAA